jgi:hypothetical protein
MEKFFLYSPQFASDFLYLLCGYSHSRVELFSFEIFQNPFEKFWPSMEYRNKFFQLLEDGKILPQYGIILIGTSFQTLHAHTSWFGPN